MDAMTNHSTHTESGCTDLRFILRKQRDTAFAGEFFREFRVLQWRTRRCDSAGGGWTDWQDVPIVTEPPMGT